MPENDSGEHVADAGKTIDPNVALRSDSRLRIQNKKTTPTTYHYIGSRYSCKQHGRVSVCAQKDGLRTVCLPAACYMHSKSASPRGKRKVLIHQGLSTYCYMHSKTTQTTLFQHSEKPVKYWSARDLMPRLGYKRWSNFAGVVERAIGIIKHKHLKGDIVKTNIVIVVGQGAKREIADYLLDQNGMSLLCELCSSYKLNNFYSIRNETVVLQLVEKYCQHKNVDFQHQYRLGKFRFDCKVGNNILIEFDEPHHQHNPRQKEIDAEKNVVAKNEGFSMYRVNVEMDIVDIIIYLEAHFLGQIANSPSKKGV